MVFHLYVGLKLGYLLTVIAAVLFINLAIGKNFVFFGWAEMGGLLLDRVNKGSWNSVVVQFCTFQIQGQVGECLSSLKSKEKIDFGDIKKHDKFPYKSENYSNLRTFLKRKLTNV